MNTFVRTLTLLAVVCLASLALASRNSAPRYELKFQSELDNSTTIKRPSQQQIFKCQVKLALTNSNGRSSNNVVARLRFKSTTKIIPQTAVDSTDSNYSISNITSTSIYTDGSGSSSSNNGGNSGTGGSGGTNSRGTNSNTTSQRLPSDVRLTIDWLKDGRQLSSLESVSVVNVELKGNSSWANDKRNKTRIEIKNTVNGAQVKLSSRLKLNHLRPTDSGRYQCVARCTFVIAQASEPTGEQSVGRQQFAQLEQTLESSEAHLLVADTSAGE